MELVLEILRFLSAGMMGLLVGALLAEGALLVPYWRTLAADEFYRLHKTYGPRLYKFYAPLTISATSLTSISGLASVLAGSPEWRFSAAAAILALLLVGIYFAFFQRSNAKLAAESIPANELPAELTRWAAWHWTRVAVGVIAFAFCLAALLD